jgi:phosphoserine aminotransferase
MAKRVFNFNPGPAILPVPVLEQASKSVLEFGDKGMSLLEMSHRSKDYEKINEETEADLKSLMGLGDEYKVIFVGGGASTQFTMIPTNFLREGTVADYVFTGEWAKRAIKEAKMIGTVNVAASSEDRKFAYIPKQFNLTKDAAYVHITTNNTIYGTQWHFIPEVGDVPLFADMSSDILSHEMDFTKFSFIYAGAQKNLGAAGVTVVILKKSLLEKTRENIPTMLNYKTHVDNNSLYNTPPVFSVYVVHLVLKWLKEQGGLKAMHAHNKKKADLLYTALDEHSDFYKPNVDKDSRSWMNITFRLPNEDLEKKFAEEAKKEGLEGLKGHRSAGGMRASLYNAFPYEGVEKLVEFMKSFKTANAHAVQA